MRIFLLVGEANMVGRAAPDSIDQAPAPRVWMLDPDGQWVPAVDPMHRDQKNAGVGPGRAFALAVLEHDRSSDIGLVPAAVAGTSLSEWLPGATDVATKSHPYDDAIARARTAMERGDLAGILWHQGESDATRAGASAYATRLRTIITRFRTDLGAGETPFLLGQVGRFPARAWDRYRVQIDSANRRITETLPRTALVSSAGLTDIGDRIHFDARSERELGRRYAQKYLKLLESRGP